MYGLCEHFICWHKYMEFTLHFSLAQLIQYINIYVHLFAAFGVITIPSQRGLLWEFGQWPPPAAIGVGVRLVTTTERGAWRQQQEGGHCTMHHRQPQQGVGAVAAFWSACFGSPSSLFPPKYPWVSSCTVTTALTSTPTICECIWNTGLIIVPSLVVSKSSGCSHLRDLEQCVLTFIFPRYYFSEGEVVWVTKISKRTNPFLFVLPRFQSDANTRVTKSTVSANTVLENSNVTLYFAGLAVHATALRRRR